MSAYSNDASKMVEVLDEALALIELGWTRYALCRDADDRPTMLSAQSACSWCATGAIYKSAPDFDFARRTTEFVETLLPGHDDLPEFNDTHQYEQVVEVLTAARNKAASW